MRKKIFITILTLVGCTIIGFGFILNSLISPNGDCSYTEQEIKLKPEVATASILVFRFAQIASYPEYQCLPILGAIHNKIIRPSEAADGYENIKVLKNINEGSLFKLYPVKLMRVTKHGITTIDSGSGPYDYLILKDDKENLYKVFTVHFGINERDRFLKLITKAGEETVLTHDANLAVQ